MRTLLVFLLLFCTIILAAQQADRFTETGINQPVGPMADQMNFVPNEVLVKFKDEVTLSAGTKLKSAGITSIDQVLKSNGAGSLEKLFPTAKRLKSVRIVKDPQGRDMKIPNLDNIYKIVIPQTKSTASTPVDLFKFIEELKVLPEVEYVEPNFVYSIGDFKPAGPEMTMFEAINQPANANLPAGATGLVPNDPLYNSQWGIPATKIDVVWNTTTGDSTAIIAILDTGVDWQHPDLAANIWNNKLEIPGNGIDDDGNGLIDDIRGWDYINNDNNPMDDNSHGTHVAGIAAAVGNNRIGIAGVNWKARIMPIKVFQSSGRGDAATIATGITYAATKGATVINMSFGSYAESFTIKSTLSSAYATAILVAAAGNDGMQIGPCINCVPMYPGAYSFVLGVEADKKIAASCGTGGMTIRACFSNLDQDGPVFSAYADLLNYELKAPGAVILSCVPGGNYREYSGTSMAAPLVAGAVSLYHKQKPSDSQEIIFGNFIKSIDQHVDIEKALQITPVPNLNVVSFELGDSIDGDRDKRADVGETIELKVKVRNTWGQANDVKVGIDFDEFEDPGMATILNSEATIGSIAAYATRENVIPLKIKMAQIIKDGRDVVFKLKTWYGAHQGETSQRIVLTIENGIELKGIVSSDMTLYPDKQYIVTSNFVVDQGATLTIKPGTILKLSENKSFVVAGTVIAIGKPDSLIVFTKRDLSNSWGSLGVTGPGKITMDYCSVSYATSFGISVDWANYRLCPISNTIFNNNYGSIGAYQSLNMKRCVITNNLTYNGVFNGLHVADSISNTNIFRNKSTIWAGAFYTYYNPNLIRNALFGNYAGETEMNYYTQLGGFSTIKLPPNYYGTTNEDKINKTFYDFEEEGSKPLFNFSDKLIIPSKENHGFVWKVVVNGKDAQDEYNLLDPLGVGRQKFEVWFNCPMDISKPPLVSMGTVAPFTQTSITEDGTWSADSTKFTVYKTISLTTGDGINTICVSGAKDVDHFVIPVEDHRFRVVVSAASSASSEFMATPELGKVKLEWNNSALADGLGFNLYRMEHLNDLQLTKPVIINSTLITDTLYTDFAVTPNKKYYYYYKILRTNLSETDSSKIVSAIPFTASKGDANGDLNVNVLDITTIVAYLLNNGPAPFITEAADYNSDGNINVLDIVGVVNFVLNGGKKSGEIGANPQIHLYVKNDTLFANSPVAIGGIQFEIGGAASIEEIQKLKALEGFESGYSQQENGLRLLYFSMSGKSIPAGEAIPLLKLKKGSGLTEAIFANQSGTPIPYDYLVSEVGKIILNPEHLVAELGQNYPNPLSRLTTIPIRIYEPVDDAIIRVYNSSGQELRIIRLPNPIVGEHLLQWDSGLHKGLFVYRLEVRQGNKQIVCPARKMLVK